jgi:hypothetical protein
MIDKINFRRRIMVVLTISALSLTLLLIAHTEPQPNGSATVMPSGYTAKPPSLAIVPTPETPKAATIREDLKPNPNIIVVLSESLWDLTKLEAVGVKYSRDPLAFLHSLGAQYTSGSLLSPMFGGETANVELEVLTGNSYRYQVPGTLAYTDTIQFPTDSLASILARRGYTSTVISPMESWFAGSKDIYRLFGFSRFVSLEYFDPNEYIGPYIGDRYVAKRIIEQTEASPGADFIFANTMENHYHYWPGKFDDNTIDVDGKMSSDSRGLLETYAQGAQEADKMLQSLVEHYSQSDEPTILVFFGDHLPYLEDDYMVYRDTGYLKTDDPDFLTKTHDTPFVIWNNYLNVPRESLHISPVYISPYVLHLAGIPGTAYTDFLYNLSKKYPLLPAEEYDESLGIAPDDDLLKLQEIEDDILFGEQAIYGADKDRIVDENFVMGYGPPKIKRVSVLDGKILRVEGGRYGQGCVIYVNDKPLKTKWQSETTLIATLPENAIGKNGQPAEMQVEVRVIDENKDVLGRSETVPFLIK